MKQQPVVMTIAGSDSGGGAGIQADLKTMTVLGAYGTSVLTCVTAQNPSGVSAIQPIAPDVVVAQMESVLSAFPVSAVKTGMLFSTALIEAVAGVLESESVPVLVVDPVMVAASGARLLQEDAVTALSTRLIPLARVLTPNVHEAELLCGHTIRDLAAQCAAAREIADRYDVACLLKGAHIDGPEVVDVLVDGEEEHLLRAARVAACETHGAGCTLSAALATLLARGCLLPEAARRAKAYVGRCLAEALPVGPHAPLAFRTAAAGMLDD